jgi:thioredoxin
MTLTETQNFLQNQPLALIYFSANQCGVCHAIKPRVQAITEKVNVPFVELNAGELPEVASVFQVMTIPAVLLFANGKEYHRQARFINVVELEEELRNPPQAVDYGALFALHS